MLLLAFGNKARHGKDTAGEAVVNYYNDLHDLKVKHLFQNSRLVPPLPPAALFKFADALYQECRQQHGMTQKDSPLLQRVGQSRRLENENYWIDKVFEQIDLRKPLIAVLTDIRYQNEAAAVKARGGFVINVSRLNLDGTPYVADDRPADHISEIDLDGYRFDHYIRAYTGEVALVQELAITIAEYAKGLKS